MAKWKTGNADPNNFQGTNKNDFYKGLGGQDSIQGMGGNDHLKGGNGNDAIVGGKGNDKIWGDAGFDIISGDEGKDILWGGADTDSFIFRVGGKFGVGSDIDIIKDVDTSGGDMDHIQIMSIDFLNPITSFGDVMKFAKQSGHDVKIDFGHGDVLILADTKIADLSPGLFMFQD